MPTIDDIFRRTGDLGRQQLLYVSALSAVHMHYPLHMLMYTFAAREVGFECADADDACNCTAGYAYAAQRSASVVSDFDLVCERSWLRPLTMTVFMLGVLLGAVVLGSVSDAFGRRLAIFLTLAGMIATNAASAAAPGYVSYCAARCGNGFFCGGHILALAVLCNELTGSTKRGISSLMMGLTWPLGILLLCLLAYAYPHWRALANAVTAIGIPLLALYFFLPESPRWLQKMDRLDEANREIRRIVEGNGEVYLKEFALTKYDRLREEAATGGKDVGTFLCDLFSHPKLLATTLVLMYSWFVHGATYFGLTLLASTSRAGDIYTSTALSAAVEIPATVFAPVLMSVLGRRISLCCVLVTCGLGLLADIPLSAFPPLVPWLNLVWKLCISSGFSIIYVHTSEILPTPIRTKGLGLVAIASRLGGMLSPFLAQLEKSAWPNLEYVVFGLLACSSGALDALLPETLGMAMPGSTADLVSMVAGDGNGGDGDGGYALLALDERNSEDDDEPAL